MKFVNLLAIVALLVGATAGAQEAEKPKNGPFNTIKEVFLKGSIDGKHMFMVLGMEKGFETTKDVAEWIVTERDLDGYANRGEKLAQHIYNGGDDDFVEATENGIEAAGKLAPRILERPWRSLKEIPKSFEVNLENGREAYYNSKSSVGGAVKYSGWAAWAVIEGAYYLVIEAPARFTLNLVGTALAVPAAWTWQALVVGYDVLALGLRTAWIGIKAAVAIPCMLAVEGYSILSSTVATTLTVIAAGGLAIAKGAKFLFVEAPRRIFYPVTVKQDTGIEFNDKEQENLANQVLTYFSSDDNSLGVDTVESKITKYKSRIDLFKTTNGVSTHYGVVRVTIAQKEVHARIDISRKMFKAMKKQGITRAQVKEMMSKALQEATKKPAEVKIVENLQQAG